MHKNLTRASNKAAKRCEWCGQREEKGKEEEEVSVLNTYDVVCFTSVICEKIATF